MKSFSVQVSSGREGQDGRPAVGPIYRNILSKDEFPPPHPEVSTTWDSFRLSVEKYPGNKMLGWREMVDGKWGPYLWKTYRNVYEEVLKIGSALRACGAQPGARIGIYGANCPQWIVAMEACAADSLICVPLYDTLGPGAINYIIDHAEIDYVLVHPDKVKELLNPDCTSSKRLKSVVCFTSLTEEETQKARNAGIEAYSWNQFLQMGKENPSELVPPQTINICTIMYTSGTSGDPKGVILTHETMAMFICGLNIFMDQFEDKMSVDDVYLSFLPLAHVLDRVVEEYFFHKGASVGYFHGNVREIGEDLMELKPTFFAGVPKVFDRVYEGIQKAIADLLPHRRMIFHLLYKYKLFWMNLGYKHKNASPLADLLAFRKVKNKLGGRIRLMVSGAAPWSEEVEEFLRVTCGCFVLQAYGLTETCGLSTVCFPDEMSMLGSVGVPSVYTELCLKEVPEMGYHPLTDPPRGEICLRGKTLFSGYYKNPQLTAESIRDGWFHTGDIGEMLPNGTVKIIDRKKNLIKLSQGEYVALEYIEKVYSISPIVEDIWVYGDSLKSMLVAVVVPNEDNTKKWADKNGCKGTFAQLCSLNEFRTYVLSELRVAGERNKLRGFEHVKGVILESQTFEMIPSLLTPTMKKRRDKVLKHYQAEIDDLYCTLAKGKC
ncbi:long chain acyl-CoA synthetase 1 [Beta vulgaris subsp. vulgaris]|uniref:long chain acyl-CoA synthetase 1 n=1 Tax=Beta vulgaris subsp. vulgaris TaxID=3555 RepID=UPI0020369D56|nr:long chain acyl-CoA synthetase 1 [Beta vulgaris subsp. vulgaris]XP_010679431.2 long chain acyl-CoA synthetase 1 [Beta vulgaris subsp. vulgaris]XP_048493624.1 long chain acyl-CoA synthetase 1 [Beta vulgaris subsp. vulgaris]XP_048493625.1 long chain acyl-CoA synthetase 1 [Beta vulgaris subsp. vulgaris]